MKSFKNLHIDDKVRCLEDGKIYSVRLWNGFGKKFELCICDEKQIWPITEFNPEDFEKVED